MPKNEKNRSQEAPQNEPKVIKNVIKKMIQKKQKTRNTTGQARERKARLKKNADKRVADMPKKAAKHDERRQQC